MNVEIYDGTADLMDEIAEIHGYSTWDSIDSNRRKNTSEEKVHREAKDQFENAMKDNRENNIILLCKNEEDLITGLIWLEITSSTLYGDKTGYIIDIFVKEEFRRSGIADMLLETAQQELKDRNIGRMSLNVYGNNRSALEMYRKHSFSTETIRLSKRL